MAMQSGDERWQQIREIHWEYKFFYQITGGVALVIVGILIGSALFHRDAGYATNLYTDMLSIAVTVFVLDLLGKRREKHRMKAQLIREMSSSDNGISRRAVRELRETGALQDGSLKNAFLPFANLEKADLMWANLAEAQLDGANLQEAWLDNAHLHKTSLTNTNLQGAYLQCANLPYANLSGANLRGAHFAGAALAFANLSGAKYDKTTILPDSTNWKPDTDMARFTNPEHPNFWISNNPSSPAYYEGIAKEDPNW